MDIGHTGTHSYLPALHYRWTHPRVTFLASRLPDVVITQRTGVQGGKRGIP